MFVYVMSRVCCGSVVAGMYVGARDVASRSNGSDVELAMRGLCLLCSDLPHKAAISVRRGSGSLLRAKKYLDIPKMPKMARRAGVAGDGPRASRLLLAEWPAVA